MSSFPLTTSTAERRDGVTRLLICDTVRCSKTSALGSLVASPSSRCNEFTSSVAANESTPFSSRSSSAPTVTPAASCTFCTTTARTAAYAVCSSTPTRLATNPVESASYACCCWPNPRCWQRAWSANPPRKDGTRACISPNSTGHRTDSTPATAVPTAPLITSSRPHSPSASVTAPIPCFSNKSSTPESTAIPAPAQAPHCTLLAAWPCSWRTCTSASMHAFAAA